MWGGGGMEVTKYRLVFELKECIYVGWKLLNID